MVERPYPTSLAEIDPWRARAGVSLDEARKRFMQYVVLESIAASAIGPRLAFKGGNALRFVFMNVRATIDLDFTAESDFPDNEAEIRALITQAVDAGARRFGVVMRLSSSKRHPPAGAGTMPTWEVRVAWQLPGDRHFEDLHVFPGRIATTIEVEISLNDVICETQSAALDPERRVQVRVCVLEDIIAEKLRSLLQQKVRRRHRKQDLYDIARMVMVHGAALDRGKVSSYFIRKCSARDIEPGRSAFDEEVLRRASFDYESLFDAKDPNFIPVGRAWEILTEFVGSLAIPD